MYTFSLIIIYVKNKDVHNYPTTIAFVPANRCNAMQSELWLTQNINKSIISLKLGDVFKSRFILDAYYAIMGPQFRSKGIANNSSQGILNARKYGNGIIDFQLELYHLKVTKYTMWKKSFYFSRKILRCVKVSQINCLVTDRAQMTENVTHFNVI